jgi:hypothetical protein
MPLYFDCRVSYRSGIKKTGKSTLTPSEKLGRTRKKTKEVNEM